MTINRGVWYSRDGKRPPFTFHLEVTGNTPEGKLLGWLEIRGTPGLRAGDEPQVKTQMSVAKPAGQQGPEAERDFRARRRVQIEMDDPRASGSRWIHFRHLSWTEG